MANAPAAAAAASASSAVRSIFCEPDLSMADTAAIRRAYRVNTYQIRKLLPYASLDLDTSVENLVGHIHHLLEVEYKKVGTVHKRKSADAADTFEKIRIDYLRGLFHDRDFKARIEKRDAEARRTQEVRDVLEMWIVSGATLCRSLNAELDAAIPDRHLRLIAPDYDRSNDDIPAFIRAYESFISQMTALHTFCNEAMVRVSRDYGDIRVPIINLTTMEHEYHPKKKKKKRTEKEKKKAEPSAKRRKMQLEASVRRSLINSGKVSRKAK